MAWFEYIPGYRLMSSITTGLKEGFDIGAQWVRDAWRDYTGQTAIDMQNEANLNMAKYQSQMEEELYNKYRSPAALMRQYAAAGLNPNLIYGSASAGISGAPSFNAPHVERNMSGSEKVNTALTALSQVLGLKQAMYNTEVARESSEQSAIKTLSDRVGLAEKEGNLRLKNTLYGGPVFDDLYVRRRKGADPFIGVNSVTNNYMANYIKAYRSNQLNSLYRDQFSNIADYGISATDRGLKLDSYFGTPSIRTRNATNSLKYRLQSELGNMGTYGKLIISLFDLLK